MMRILIVIFFIGIVLILSLGLARWRRTVPAAAELAATNIETSESQPRRLPHPIAVANAAVPQATTDAAAWSSLLHEYHHHRQTAVFDHESWFVEQVLAQPELVDKVIVELQNDQYLDESITLALQAVDDDDDPITRRMIMIDMLETVVASARVADDTRTRAWEGLHGLLINGDKSPAFIDTRRAVIYAEAYDALEIIARHQPEIGIRLYQQQRARYPQRLALALAGGLMDAGWPREQAYAAAGL